MDNIEKAKELVSKFKIGTSISPFVNDVMYDAILEMAKWKDEEVKNKKEKFIDKAVKWLKNNIDNYYMTCEFEEWFDDMFDDFRIAMKNE